LMALGKQMRSSKIRKLWRSRALWISLVVVTVGTFVQIAFHPRYAVRDYVKDVKVLWHDEECFIIIPMGSQGWTGNYFTLNLGRLLVRSNLASDVPEPMRSNLVIFRYHHGLNRYCFRGFEGVGSISPFKGQLYNTVGGRKRKVFRWNEDKFVELTDQEAEQLITEEKQLGEFMEQDRLTKEGWQKSSIYRIPIGTTQIPIRLRTGQLILVLDNSTKKPPFSVISVYLQGPGEDEMTPLLDIDESWRFVDYGDYSEYSK